ncbi:MAG: hypothetical protein H6712_23305 [Myxococcales bacterium]|nr:hypothetical protein [Myxococcales bacterium]
MAIGLVLTACRAEPGIVPSLDALRQPTGLAVSPTGAVLLVTNGNWDRVETDSTLMAVDLAELFAALEDEGSGACRRVSSDDPTLECNPAAFIDPQATVRLGTGAGNIAIDQPAGEAGLVRLLVTTRSPASVTWMDLVQGGEGVRLDCGQDDDQRCGEAHEIRASDNDRLPGEPSRVVVDDQGARYAYVPHLLGGALSLLALDGENGPELADVEGDFFRAGPFEDEELIGGFGVASLPCDPLAPSDESRDCERPVLFASQRYFPGVRQFGVAPGLDLLLSGPEVTLDAINPEVVEARPFMGDLVFEDAHGDHLLVVQTTPPALLRVDTRLGDDGSPRNALVGALPLCDNPNVIAVTRPEAGEEAVVAEPLALVTCRSAGRLAVVGLGSFRMLASVPVGEGAHEVVVDHERGQAYVSNPEEDTISIVELDPRSPRRFQEWARLGLGAGTRD